MSALLIESSTPLCLLQDAGRFGVRHLGVTQGGALDWVSMSWANRLLNNALDATVIEITLGSLTLLAEDDCCLALAGPTDEIALTLETGSGDREANMRAFAAAALALLEREMGK